ncbi:MAG: amidohydrolase [Betaproteobacteria bacterium]|nr:amidohydrolase [Betaproteobacteria bacterium]
MTILRGPRGSSVQGGERLSAGARAAAERGEFLKLLTASAGPAASGGGPARVERGPADTLIVNARVATLDSRGSVASALAVKGDRIAATGSEAELAPLRGSATQVIDAGGRTVIPGLNDAHTHFVRGGLGYAQETRWDGVASLGDALRRLREQAARTPAPNWVQVIGGWSPEQFVEKRFPTLEEINAVSADVPVLVMHLYDRLWLNRAAIRALGWNKDTPDVMGGVIERDARGAPTGLVTGRTTLAGLVSVVLRIPALSPEQQALSTRHFMRECNRLGLTSVIDHGGSGQFYPKDYQIILDLARRGEMNLRVGYWLMGQNRGRELSEYEAWAKMVKPGDGDGDGMLRMLGGGEYLVWAAADIANFGYEFNGFAPVMEEQLAGVMSFVAQGGWPFRLHTVYDSSCERVLNVVEQVAKEAPVAGLRWGLEHCELISERNLERLAKLGGSIGIQNRINIGGAGFVGKFGAQAALAAPPIARIREMGIPLAAGTDGNRGNSHNPWLSLYWLVTGRTVGGHKLAGDGNLLDRAEALRLWTQGGAWVSGEDRLKGTLEPGKWADLAILSADYFSVADESIMSLESVLTMVGGRIVYGGGPFTRHAPPPLPVSPDWLPVGGPRPAGAAVPPLSARHRHPVIFGDGGPWALGCGCALL